MPLPSQEDINYLRLIRDNVNKLLASAALRYSSRLNGIQKILDIAPQDHTGAKPFFPTHTEIDTLDILPGAGATYIADLCANNEALIPSESYDFVVCTEVLEHTLRPFDAVKEIKRILKPKGALLLSVPFNFRIHGPLPDCWRFTEHGLRAILSDFDIIEINSLDTPGRTLMPIHYTVIAEKP